MVEPSDGPASGLFAMVPAGFGWNAEAAASNVFQCRAGPEQPALLARAARSELLGLVEALAGAGVAVELLEEPRSDPAPDAVFLNNWFSTHADGTLVLYPMATAARRAERRPELVERISRSVGASEVFDLSGEERAGRFLEGTGSLVLDREARVAYAARSPRTDPELVHAWCERMRYEPVVFDALHRGVPVYHTNVLLSIGRDVALLCAEVVSEPGALRERLAAGGRAVCELSVAQFEAFCGNALEVASTEGELVWAMGAGAADALGPELTERLGRIVSAPLNRLERVGGGSARCALAERVPARDLRAGVR